MENEVRNETQSVDEVAVVDVPRRLSGLVSGRILNFVIASGDIRPLLVVNPLNGFGPVNGILFFDPATDSAETLGVPLLPNKYGHAPLFCVPLSNVPYEELALNSGTWHWPARPSPLVASAVDPAALSTQIEAILAPVIDAINAKLDAHLKATSDLLESQDADNSLASKIDRHINRSGFPELPVTVGEAGAVSPNAANPFGIQFTEHPMQVVSDAVGDANVLVPAAGVSLDDGQKASDVTPEPESTETPKTDV